MKRLTGSKQGQSGTLQGRDKLGRIMKGYSGNPKGKPPMSPEEKEKRIPLAIKLGNKIIRKPKVIVPRKADGTFPEGVSGNPNGRPKGYVGIATMLKRKLGEEMYDSNGQPTGITYEEALITRLMALAINDGNVQAIKEAFDRTEGKPVQPLSGIPERPAEHTAVVDAIINEAAKFAQRYGKSKHNKSRPNDKESAGGGE